MFKVNNKNTRTTSLNVSVVNFEQVSSINYFVRFCFLNRFLVFSGGKENINRDEMGLKRLERTLPNAFKKL